jgi:hypothetical protein
MLYLDTHSARIEPTLASRWIASAPEYIVYEPFETPPGTQLLSSESIRAWLTSDCEAVWESPDAANRIGLYRVRRTTYLQRWLREHPAAE